MFEVEQTAKLAPDWHLALQRRVDRRCRLAVVLLEQMGIDAQGDIGLRMPESLGNRDDIHAGINQRARVGMPQIVEGEIRHFNWSAKSLHALLDRFWKGRAPSTPANSRAPSWSLPAPSYPRSIVTRNGNNMMRDPR